MAMERSPIWVGVFDGEAPQDFFDEQFDDDTAPISAFAASQLGMRQANVFVLCDHAEVDSPVTVRRPGLLLHFIGTFAYSV